MSKFLKAIVDIVLVVAILVAGGLLIPPFAGVHTLIVDDVDMETNLSVGTVVYAVEEQASVLKNGDRVLLFQDTAQNMYEVVGVEGDNYLVEDKLSVDGDQVPVAMNSQVKKIVFGVPYVGYVSMALKTTEGLIIVGLSVVFLIILFVIAEIWKKDEDDEEEEDEEDIDEEELGTEAAPSEPSSTEKEKEPAPLLNDLGIDVEEVQRAMEENENMVSETKESSEETILGDDLQQTFAADVAAMMGEKEDVSSNIEETEGTKVFSVLDIEQAIEQVAAREETEQKEESYAEPIEKEEEPEEKVLAMPVYTKEELLAKAKQSGEEPKVIEDENCGITLVDYSDIL